MMSKKKAKSAAPHSGALSNLLSAICDLVRTYLVISEAQCVVIALWVIHTYYIDAFDRTPYLHISSAEKRSGKTLLLEILALLVYNPWFTSNASTAAIARKIASARPTVLIDEADTFLLGTGERADLLRGVLNAGFAKNGTYSRVSGAGEVVDLSVFSAKVIAGLECLPDTVADRSVPLQLKRATAEERRRRYDRHEVEHVASGVRAQLLAHTQGCAPAFLRPAIIEQLNDRQNDIVEPLLAIANLAGGKWPEKARAALLELFTRDAEEYQNAGTQLLTDIRDIFNEAGVEEIQTKELIRQLRQREESPWSDYHHGKALTTYALARILKPYKIQTRVWWEVGRAVRGYQRRDFDDAWRRYLPQPASAGSGLPSSANRKRKARPAGTGDSKILVRKARKHASETKTESKARRISKRQQASSDCELG